MPSKPTPGSLDAVQVESEGIDRFRAAADYVTRALAKADEGRAVRDEEVRRLCAEHGPAETARMTGLSLGSVKAINRGSRR